MNDWTARRARYQRDNGSIQLGGLASNLSRIAWCAERVNQQQALPVLRESKYFTEWSAPLRDIEQQGLLAELQRDLAVWERQWGRRMDASEIAQAARQWSQRLLEAAGMLRAS